jgi:hypothetical protein
MTRTIDEQIKARPVGPQQELLDLMYEVYQREYGRWPEDPRFDIFAVDTTAEIDPVPGQDGFCLSIWMPGERQRLSRLQSAARGWFYVDDGVLRFIDLHDWETFKTEALATS